MLFCSDSLNIRTEAQAFRVGIVRQVINTRVEWVEIPSTPTVQ